MLSRESVNISLWNGTHKSLKQQSHVASLLIQFTERVELCAKKKCWKFYSANTQKNQLNPLLILLGCVKLGKSTQKEWKKKESYNVHITYTQMVSNWLLMMFWLCFNWPMKLHIFHNSRMIKGCSSPKSDFNFPLTHFASNEVKGLNRTSSLVIVIIHVANEVKIF